MQCINRTYTEKTILNNPAISQNPSCLFRNQKNHCDIKQDINELQLRTAKLPSMMSAVR